MTVEVLRLCEQGVKKHRSGRVDLQCSPHGVPLIRALTRIIHKFTYEVKGRSWSGARNTRKRWTDWEDSRVLGRVALPEVPASSDIGCALVVEWGRIWS